MVLDTTIFFTWICLRHGGRRTVRVSYCFIWPLIDERMALDGRNWGGTVTSLPRHQSPETRFILRPPTFCLERRWLYFCWLFIPLFPILVLCLFTVKDVCQTIHEHNYKSLLPIGSGLKDGLIKLSYTLKSYI